MIGPEVGGWFPAGRARTIAVGTGAYVQFRGAGSGTTETADLGSGPVTNIYVGFLIG